MDRILGSCFPWSWLVDSVFCKLLCFRKKTTLDVLPNEVVLQILSRLPATSIIRFLLVCKEWCLLTSTQSFIEMHEHNQPTPLDSVFVIQYFDRERTVPRFQFKTFFINEKATSKNKRFQMVREYLELTRARDPEQYYYIDLLSSYKGFLLFSAKSKWPEKQESALILYNPATKKQVTVTGSPSRYVYCGFYFHSPTKEYRILYKVFNGNNQGMIARFEILSLQTGAMKKVDVNEKLSVRYHPDTSTPAVISNGVLHWMVLEAEHERDFGVVPSCSETILCFGMESEEFHLMPHPRLHGGCHDCVSLPRNPGHQMNLLEMDGGVLCLCDGYKHERYSRSELTIFMIEDYEKWRWIRRFVVPIHAYLDPGSFYGSNVKAVKIHEGELVLYYHAYNSTGEYFLYPLDDSYKFI